MFSESFMKYLIKYQSEESEPQARKMSATSHFANKRPSMIDLIGAKYVTVPIKHSAE